MGDAAKPCFVRRNKDRVVLNEDDFQRGALRHDYQVLDDYGNGHSNRMDVEKRRGALGHYGTSPRKGIHGVLGSPKSSKNFIHNQGTRINDASKDHIKKWEPDNHRTNSESWREYKCTVQIPVIIRARNDSFHECESLGSRNVRRHLQKDLSEDVPERKGSSGNVHIFF